MKASVSKIISSMEAVRNVLAGTGLLLDWNDAVTQSVKRGLRRVTWATMATQPELSEFDVSTVEEYLIFLEGRHFNVMLSDGALIQMSYDVDSQNKVACSRLVWYPCPVVFSPEELNYASIRELVTSAPSTMLACRAPLRIDYAPELVGDNHSVTHMHFGSEVSRIPVQRPLEPKRFLRLILRSTYPQIWGKHEGLREVEDWGGEDRLDVDDRLVGALSWNLAGAAN